MRALAGLKPSQTIPVIFVTGRSELAHILHEATNDIKTLTKANSLKVLDPNDTNSQIPVNVLAGVSGELQVLLPLEGLVDIDGLKMRLEKDLVKAEKDISTLSGRLANSNFTQKAPAKVVEECRLNLNEAKAQAELASKRLLDLSSTNV